MDEQPTYQPRDDNDTTQPEPAQGPQSDSAASPPTDQTVPTTDDSQPSSSAGSDVQAPQQIPTEPPAQPDIAAQDPLEAARQAVEAVQSQIQPQTEAAPSQEEVAQNTGDSTPVPGTDSVQTYRVPTMPESPQTTAATDTSDLTNDTSSLTGASGADDTNTQVEPGLTFQPQGPTDNATETTSESSSTEAAAILNNAASSQTDTPSIHTFKRRGAKDITQPPGRENDTDATVDNPAATTDPLYGPPTADGQQAPPATGSTDSTLDTNQMGTETGPPDLPVAPTFPEPTAADTTVDEDRGSTLTGDKGSETTIETLEQKAIPPAQYEAEVPAAQPPEYTQPAVVEEAADSQAESPAPPITSPEPNNTTETAQPQTESDSTLVPQQSFGPGSSEPLTPAFGGNTIGLSHTATSSSTEPVVETAETTGNAPGTDGTHTADPEAGVGFQPTHAPDDPAQAKAKAKAAANTFQMPATLSAAPPTHTAPEDQVSRLDQPINAPEASTAAGKFKTKAEQAGTKLKSINYKPFISAAVIGILIFGIFNSQVILGQVQYLTTPSGGLDAPAANIDALDPAGNEDKILIPKINVDVPVVYDEPSFDEEKVQKALERGVVHYGTTALPGENGNSVIVGHSSNNWWDSGDYKFAFILLDKLAEGDQIVLHYNDTRYVYEVTDKVVVEPSDISVLSPTSNPTLTLITCTPPGTSWQRLVVKAEQISPDPRQNSTVASPLDVPAGSLPSDSTGGFLDFIRNLF